MNRLEVKEELFALGISGRGKGLENIVDIIVIMDKGWKDVPITKIYQKIGKDNGIKGSCVERRIRVSLSGTRKDGLYASEIPSQNGKFLRWLYTMLKEKGEEMKESKNVYGVNKMTLAAKLYEMMLDDCAFNPEEYNSERFSECFMSVLQDYGLFLKNSMIE